MKEEVFSQVKKHLLSVVISVVVAMLLVGGTVMAKAEPPFTVALSNGFIGSEWRTQMIDDFKQVFEEYKEKGLVDKYIVQSAGVDTSKQIAQIRNMIMAGVDAIIINPNSQTALNPVIEEAARAGIIVICVDQEVTSPKALNVVIDQSEWARISARWLVEQLNGEGNIVAINGVAGHPANEDRWEGAKEVFDAAPGINILTDTNADWDQATGQRVMSDLIATYPEIDGVWVQDGMAEGALRAMLASGRKLPVMTGEARVGYLRLWKEQKDKRGFSTIGVVNPPGIAGTGLRVAIHLLQGKELKEGLVKGNTLYVPIPGVITNENFDEWWEEYKDKPDSYTLDGMLTDEEVQEFFK